MTLKWAILLRTLYITEKKHAPIPKLETYTTFAPVRSHSPLTMLAFSGIYPSNEWQLSINFSSCCCGTLGFEDDLKPDPRIHQPSTLPVWHLHILAWNKTMSPTQKTHKATLACISLLNSKEPLEFNDYSINHIMIILWDINIYILNIVIYDSHRCTRFPSHFISDLLKTKNEKLKHFLVGGWTTPSENFARQIGNLPQGSGWK